jgi:hypothetical protein
VNERRYVNQYQPQTLFMATILLYINAAFDILSVSPLLVLSGVLLGVGAYGIANERKFGYTLAVAVAVLRVLLFLTFAGSDAFDFPYILTLMFDVALVGLLVHPESREYHRIWFK